MAVYEFDKLVWEREEEKPVEILDEVEKQWLKHFIKSTKIKVNYIVKNERVFYNDREYLKIGFGEGDYVALPYFKKDTMYKNMKVGREYTLEELGLVE